MPMKGNAQTPEIRVTQLQEANAALLKAFAPIIADLSKDDLQERIIGNRRLTNELADGLGVWRVLHGRSSWETLCARANVCVTESDAGAFSMLLRETDEDVTGWWPIRVPRVDNIGRFTPHDDVVAAIKKRYRQDRSGDGPATALQLFAFAARHLLLKDEVTVVTIDPALKGPIPAFTFRKKGPLAGRHVRLCWTDLDLQDGCDVYVAIDSHEDTPGGLKDCC